MAFSRDFLTSVGLTEAQVASVMQEHVSVTDALKAQRDDAKKELEASKKEAEKVPEMQKELDKLKDIETKYNKAVSDHDAYVKEIEVKETAEKVKTAYRKLLADEQIKADRIDFVINHTDLSNMKLDKDGNLEAVDELKKTINDSKDGWGMFKVKTGERGTKVGTPPDGGTGTGTSRARELYLEHLKQQGVKVEDTGKE